jgi:hypothetical protein
VDREAVRRWITGHRAAEQRSLEVMRDEGAMSPELSFRAAMELCDLATFTASDVVRDREIEQTRTIWVKLKKPWVAKRA